MSRRFRALAVLAARAADDKKADQIVLRHLRRSSLAEYLLVATVNSSAQLEAVEEHIQEKLEGQGVWALHHDGGRSGQWRVLDYGGLLVHLMQPEVRALYGLDRLYHDERSVSWTESRRRAKAAA